MSFGNKYLLCIVLSLTSFLTLWVQADEEPWGTLLSAFALVARHDPRPRVADAAGAALLDAAQKHCGQWNAVEWASVQSRAVAYVLELPFPRVSSAGVDPLGAGSTPQARVVSFAYMVKSCCLSAADSSEL